MVCPLIHNSLAETSALDRLLLFEDLGNSSPVKGVNNDSITTFLQTPPSILAISFLSSLYLVITSSPFVQDKACCKLNESPQKHSVGKRSRGILYPIGIASRKACFSRKKPFLFTGITVNQIEKLYYLLMFQLILILFSYFFYSLLLGVLHHSALSFVFWCYFLFLQSICNYLKIKFRYVLLYWLILW